MNFFDHAIMTYVNQFSQHSWTFDTIIKTLSHNHLLKGGVLAAVIWWGWFRSENRLSRNRKQIISTLVSCIAAMTLARVLALTLPFRLRPLHEESLQFLLPHGMVPAHFEGWSSFPSDHAVLFAALSTGLFFISRRTGMVVSVYTALFILFPRVYLGMHYPTDILGGAMIGIMVAVLGNIYVVKNKYVDLIVNWSYSKPSLFYPLFFLLTYQIADMFDSSRALLNSLLNVIQGIFGL